ncbi:MAG: HD domain-containing protein [Verrucomicrobia bacterium]|nr:HD domain-containing protein [Verrucomicrobiota bacterium]
MAAGVFFSFQFVEDERNRNLQVWQNRLGIVADSRAASVNEWVEQNFATMRELAENASLQLYMTELVMSKGDKSGVTDEPAQATYLRNLLVATAERTGFKPTVEAVEIAANVEKVGVAGIGLTDADGRPIVTTPQLPPITGKVRTAVAKALNGEPTVIDVFMGATNLPTIGFALPIFSVQAEGEGAQGIGVVVGIRTIGKDLFERLIQPGTTSETSETVLVRTVGGAVEYLSPLADGTPPLKRTIAIDTPNLAAAFALEKPGGFAIKRDYAGEEVLVTSRSLASLPWALMRKVARAEALSGTETRLQTMLTVFILIIIGVTVTIIAVWRHGSSIRAAEAAEKSRIAAERFENMTKFMNVVTNSQPTKIVAVSGDTKYTFANEPAAEGTGISRGDLLGKTMASVIGPVQAQTYADINREILARFAESDDRMKERESHIHTFGDDEDDEDFQIIKSDHIPLRGDRDFPPAVLMVLDDITALTQERRQKEKVLRQVINTLVSVADGRDPFSASHSTRVSEVARCVADEMGLPEEDTKTVDIAGNLVNVGKIVISRELLTKTEELTAEERDQLTKSYLTSADLQDGVDFEGPVAESIRQMSESWDGSGPLGLSGDDILITARVLSVANAFAAMISPRAYRSALTFDQVSDVLLEQSKSRYDLKPVSALISFLQNRGGIDKWAHFREDPEETTE